VIGWLRWGCRERGRGESEVGAGGGEERSRSTAHVGKKKNKLRKATGFTTKEKKEFKDPPKTL